MRSLRQALAFAFAAALLAGCASTAQMAAVPPDPQTMMPVLEERIYALVVSEREKLDPKAHRLALDAELTGVARTHSQDMAKAHMLGHTTKDGETVATILMDRDKDFQGLLGENLAGDYYSAAAGIDPDAAAARMVKSWIESPSHKEDLTFAQYARAGVGAAIDGKMIYVTVLLAADIQPPPGAQSSASDPRSVQSYRDAKSAAADKPAAEPIRMRGSEDAAIAH